MPDAYTYMGHAIRLAELARDTGERPFGCVLVNPDGAVVGKGSGSESPSDPTRHSEIAAIQEACEYANGPLRYWTLYSTHEPCLMCTGAIFHAKISTVVWGSYRNDLPLLFRPLPADRWRMTSEPPAIVAGIMRAECIALFDEELIACV